VDSPSQIAKRNGISILLLPDLAGKHGARRIAAFFGERPEKRPLQTARAVYRRIAV
jgi:hypothetical protein